MGENTPPVSAVIPFYNEAKTVAGIVERVAKHVDHVVVVDDGSTDGSAETLSGLDVHMVRHPVNRGKGASLLSGIDAARQLGAKFVISVDADGQHSPEYIPELLKKAEAETLVVGAREPTTDPMPPVRRFANRTANFFISWASGCWIQDTQCGFRIYPVSVIDRVPLHRQRRSGFVMESEVLIEACRAGYSIASVPIPALYASVLQRPSHFRPGYDVTAIVFMVAAKLLSRAMYFPGLIRCQRQRLHAVQQEAVLN